MHTYVHIHNYADTHSYTHILTYKSYIRTYVCTYICLCVLYVVLGNISKFNLILILKHYRVWSYAPRDDNTYKDVILVKLVSRSFKVRM